MDVIVDFIDDNRDELGVQPISAGICRWLQHRARVEVSAARGSAARRCVDPLLVAIWEANFRVYGVRGLCKAARRADDDLGRSSGSPHRLAVNEGLGRGKKRKTAPVRG